MRSKSTRLEVQQCRRSVLRFGLYPVCYEQPVVQPVCMKGRKREGKDKGSQKDEGANDSGAL